MKDRRDEEREHYTVLGAYITAGITFFIVMLIFKAGFDRRNHLLQLQRTGYAVVGTVIDIKSGTDSDGDTTYAPVIGYTTHEGIYRSYTMNASTGNKKVIGELVPLICDPMCPDKPETGPLRPNAAMIGATIGALFVIGIGVFIALSFLGVIQSSGSDDSSDMVVLLPASIIGMMLTRIKNMLSHT